MTFTEDTIKEDKRYLQLLAESYPTIADASTEIINMQAILNLPKPTEHFISDLHGESEAFNHILRNASGYVKRKVEEMFGTTLRSQEKQELCSLIYYPEQKLQIIKATDDNIRDFYTITINQLIKLCREVSSKYTRSRIRQELSNEFENVIEELLHEDSVSSKRKYGHVIIESIIEIQRADEFIIELCMLIQRLAIDRLHIIGDVFDRGPGAHQIMDTLLNYKSWDIVWGNHDISWFGAAAGNRACICNVLRLALRYGTMNTLEEGYGINLLPLATFAMETYADDPCEIFKIRDVEHGPRVDEKTKRLYVMMHKAITIIQFKEEAKLIQAHPEYGMSDRNLLDRINLKEGTVMVDGVAYALKDRRLPTLNADAPSELTQEEDAMMEKICHSFLTSDKLHRHIESLLTHGAMYSIANSNLMFHASVPLNQDGSLKSVEIMGSLYKGRALLTKTDHIIRAALNEDTPLVDRQQAKDYIWYLWCGPNSPLFDKDKMATFERYFIAEKSTHLERKGFYYDYQNEEKTIDLILDEFQVKGQHRHVINGHVPVKAIKGESPIKANGKLLVIDGGFSKAYHPETGIAGYTLTYHSRGFDLVQHQPFLSTQEAILNGDDIKSSTQIVEMSSERMLVKDTDKGKMLTRKVNDLKKLLFAYRNGFIKELAK